MCVCVCVCVCADRARVCFVVIDDDFVWFGLAWFVAIVVVSGFVLIVQKQQQTRRRQCSPVKLGA